MNLITYPQAPAIRFVRGSKLVSGGATDKNVIGVGSMIGREKR